MTFGLATSPDLNVAEHIGTIIKDEVERKILSETVENRYKHEVLEKHLTRCFD